MTNRYYMKFSKRGSLKYISHLDLLRLFKRAFKRAGIRLAYSKGFNPHPKLGFAQPLSLGYESREEFLEFETEEPVVPEDAAAALSPLLPEGVAIAGSGCLPEEIKSLAAAVRAAEYRIRIPADQLPFAPEKARDAAEQVMALESIPARKKNKKKQWIPLEIRPSVRALSAACGEETDPEGEPAEEGRDGCVNHNIILSTILDAGSAANLSPELLLEALSRIWNADWDRSLISVTRVRIIFDKNLHL